MKKNVCIINTIDDYRDFVKRGEYNLEDTLFACFQWSTKQLLLKDKREAIVFDEVLSDDERADADEFIEKLCFEWFINSNGQDLIEFNSISMGPAFWLQIREYLQSLLRIYLSFSKLFQNKDHVIVYIFNCTTIKDVIKVLETRYNFKIVDYTRDNAELGMLGFLQRGIFEKGWCGNGLRAAVYSFFRPVRAIKKLLKPNTTTQRIVMFNENRFFEDFVAFWNSNQKRYRNHEFFGSVFDSGRNLCLLFRIMCGEKVWIPVLKKLSSGDLEKISQIKSRFTDYFHTDSWKEKTTFKDLSFDKLFKDFIESDFLLNLPIVIQFLNAQAVCIEEIRPRLILFPSFRWYSYVLISQLAMKMNVKTVSLEHGFAGMDSELSTYNLKSAFSYFGALGEYQRKDMLLAGINEDKIKIINHPMFGRLLPVPELTSCDNLKNPKVFLFMQGYYGSFTMKFKWEEPEIYLYEVLRFMKSLGVNDIVIRIKAPQRYWYDYINNLLRYMNCNYKLDWESDVLSLIRDSDFIIGPTSTAVLESLALGKNYYMVQFKSYQHAKDLVLSAGSVDELKQMLMDRVTQPQGKILKEYCGIDTGIDSDRTKYYDIFINTLSDISIDKGVI